ncbi:MAG: excinuclease ABC subunit UvrC [Victivallales bacterium]|nr:excinuclease ABC subunit UvrC [Victivallales bacterium]
MFKREKEQFRPGDIPARPGVYIYRDRFDKVIYVGKAVNLRQRMSHYFQPSQRDAADPKLRSLIKSIFTWEYYEVKSEEEALLLESRLIKEYAPHYNVLMRDDKRYLLLKINCHETFPRLRLARVRKDDGAVYYGPFPSGNNLRAAVTYLNRHFGLRVCRTPNPDENDHRHCLASIIRDCTAPCVGKISAAAYMERVRSVMAVFAGRHREVTDQLRARMAAAARERKFEQAAKWRDIIAVIEAEFGHKNRNFRFAALPATTGREAVQDLQAALKIATTPAVIEGFDISNIGGTLAVASMVCFENGKPARNRYRRYRIRTVDHSDDFAMMREAITRCYGRRLTEQRPLPDLIMVDGGKGQLSAAVAALVALDMPPLPVIGLAKKNEEIFVPGRSEPVVLDRSRPALRVLQALRDEAHRFAITYHRSLRSRRLQESLLDEMPGIGPARKKALLQTFGSLRELRKATAAEIAARVPGIGPAFAAELHAFLQKRPPQTAATEDHEKNRLSGKK